MTGRNKNNSRERKQTTKCSHWLLPISADPLNLYVTFPQLNIKGNKLFHLHLFTLSEMSYVLGIFIHADVATIYL